MTIKPVDTAAAQSPGPNPNPMESGGERPDDDVHSTDVSEAEPDDADIAGNDLANTPE